MYDRFKLGLVAVLFVFSLVFAVAAQAQDKKAADEKGCGYCQAVDHVAKAMRCDGCKGKDAACLQCADMAKKVREQAACKGCAGAMAKGDIKTCAACGDCAKRAPKEKGHCEFCMEKQMVAANMHCCDKCAAADKKDCAKCDEMKKMVMAVKCEMCEKGKK